MFARILRATALILAGSPAFANDRFLGNWQGNATEQGSKAPYSLTMVVFRQNGRVFQHTIYGSPLDCAGGGVVVDQGTGMLQLSEIIVQNRAICADGTIRLYLNGEENLIWEWFDPSGQFVASADLKRLSE